MACPTQAVIDLRSLLSISPVPHCLRSQGECWKREGLPGTIQEQISDHHPVPRTPGLLRCLTCWMELKQRFVYQE